MKLQNIFLSMMAVAGTLFTGCSDDDAEMPANPTEPVAVKEASTDVIYEVNPRYYGQSGCLAAVTADLDRIAATGANVLWVMPIMEPGEVNAIGSPYCVKDFKGVNAKFGTLDDVKALVDAAHAKGMKVLFDWVANHTAWDCQWITDHKDWYTQDASGNIISPPNTNWTDVAELNYDNTEMRAAMIDAMVYWIDAAGIDGYRCDNVDGVPVDFWEEAIDALRAKRSDFYMLAESSDNNYFAAGFDMKYGWSFASALTDLFNGKASPEKFLNTSIEEINSLPEGKDVMRYAINHDTAAEKSVAALYGNDKAEEAAMVLAMMLDGTPMIYSAQEISYTGTLDFFNYSTKTFDADKNATLARLSEAYRTTQSQRGGELWTYQAGKAVMFARAAGASRVLVIVNPTSSDITVKTPIEMAMTTMTNAVDGSATTLPVAVELGAYEYLVYYK